jgi:hypothetical protein
MLYEDGDIIILSVVTPSVTRPTDGGRLECRVRYKTTHLIHLIHQMADSLTLKRTDDINTFHHRYLRNNNMQLAPALHIVMGEIMRVNTRDFSCL